MLITGLCFFTYYTIAEDLRWLICFGIFFRFDQLRKGNFIIKYLATLLDCSKCWTYTFRKIFSYRIRSSDGVNAFRIGQWLYFEVNFEGHANFTISSPNLSVGGFIVLKFSKWWHSNGSIRDLFFRVSCKKYFYKIL